MSEDSFDISRVLDMTGRIALVTGGGTGLGLFVAKGLAFHGVKVYITGRRVDVLQKAASEFKGSGKGILIPLQMDATDDASIKSCVKIVTETEGRLDILVNNAGVATPPTDPDFVKKQFDYLSKDKLPYELEPTEVWQSIFNINTFAPFVVTTAFMDLLIKGAEARNDTSVVINVSSAAAGMRSQTPSAAFAYGVSKAALNSITQKMATDLAKKKIPVRVNAIEPGGIPTGIVDIKILEEYITKPFPGLTSAIPARRWGYPEEMALSGIYFAAVGFANGAILRLDGGTTLVDV